MTHREIEEREMIESYLQEKLSDVESQAFEEHYFACEECFAEVRAAGKFIAGVRYSAKAGLLPEARRQPAYGLAWAAAVVLIFTTTWVAFFELPRGRREIARQRVLIEAERGRRQALEGQMAMVRPTAAEGNLPLAILEASRASQDNEVILPPGAGQLILWIELDPGF